VLENFLINPFFAVILIAISSALLGVFVLWKKLSYFGDALSHAILLGLVLSAAFQTEQILALVFFAFIFSFLAGLISQNHYFSKDTIIMILSYFCVALAVVLNDLWLKNFYFTSYIFGDVLAAGIIEVKALAAISIVVILYCFIAFKKILLINTNQDLAKIEGIKIEFWNISFLILLALVIALSVRIVGVFLMTALLILPAAIARIFSVSAKQMMLLSLMFGVMISGLSFEVASFYDLTISPMIVITFTVVFVSSLTLKKLFS
jgi:zinc transport system permease protein